MEIRIREAMSIERNKSKVSGLRGREVKTDLKSCPFPNGFILSSGKEYSVDVGYRAILIVFASFLINTHELLQMAKCGDDGQPMNHK
jgi:hypothetical protein